MLSQDDVRPRSTVEGASRRVAEESFLGDTEAPPAPSSSGEASKAATDLPTTTVPGGARPTPTTTAAPAPTSSGLRAGFSDDNKEYNRFLLFLERFSGIAKRELGIQNRFVLNYQDKAGLPASNTTVKIYTGTRLIEEGKTTPDGRYLFFPDLAQLSSRMRVRSEWQGQSDEVVLELNGPRSFTRTFNATKLVPSQPTIDIAFIFDTTGSMGDEIARLQDTIQIIQINLAAVTDLRLRFGMVLYKDIEDDYRTQTVPFTSNLDEFQKTLNEVSADGGGDIPEDLEAALEQSLKLDWNRDGVRMSFIITDAPSQMYSDQRVTYAAYSQEARRRGIRTHSIGTGGLPTQGEVMLRQISQMTGGRYIFLSYGESGESEGGTAGSVSHHSGANFQTDKLESIIIRFAREDIASLTGRSLESGEDFFEAKRIAEEEKERTLQTLFTRALEQLADYSSISVVKGTPTLYLPFTSNEADRSTGEFFAASLLQAGTRAGFFQPVERADLQTLLGEMELSLSAAFDASQAPRIGNLVGAKLIITGQVQAREDRWDIFVRLIRVETGEILSVSRARLDKNLGL